MIRDAIVKIVEGFDLTRDEMISCMEDIMTGSATQAQIGSFITALRIKGETIEEITGAAIVMRNKSIKLNVGKNIVDLDRDDINIDRETIIDTCGTGGSGTVTFQHADTSAVIWPGGVAPTMTPTASYVDVFSFVANAAGTKWRGTAAQNFPS